MPVSHIMMTQAYFFSVLTLKMPAFVYRIIGAVVDNVREYDYVAVSFVRTVFLADIVSCFCVISFWHTVCSLLSVRLGRSSTIGVEKQADEKKSLNNNK